MKSRIGTRSVLTLAAALAGLVFTATAANAVVVFSDDFESPNATSEGSPFNGVPRTSQLRDLTKWVGATSGFGATSNGILDESFGSFTDPTGEQAYGFRYTNSGVTSAFNQIGALTLGQFYTVSFDVVQDLAVSSPPTSTSYNAGLVLFDGAGTRTNTIAMQNETFGAPSTTGVLATASGNASTDNLYNAKSFTYAPTTSNPPAQLGKDLALRFRGATRSATVDNVSVSSDPVLTGAPAVGGTIEFLDLLEAETDSFGASLTNNWTAGVTVSSITLSDPTYFSVTDLMATDIIAPSGTDPFSINFLGGPWDGTFNSNLTISTNYGDVTYTLFATTLPEPVPEPTTMLIAALGILGMCCLGRRRRKR